jgi:hypothetical protein
MKAAIHNSAVHASRTVTRIITLHTVDSLPLGRRAAVGYDNGNIRTSARCEGEPHA